MNAASDFDFDAWAALAREDPEEFELRRRAAIDALIASSPESRRRLEGMQFRIDMERRLAHTPLKACLRLSEMMWDAFLELKPALAEMCSHAAVAAAPRPRLHLVKFGAAAAPALTPFSATVLNFVPGSASRQNGEDSG
jgi:hypothetical protein